MTKSEKIGSDLDEDDDVFLIELERTESGIGLGLIDGLVNKRISTTKQTGYCK